MIAKIKHNQVGLSTLLAMVTGSIFAVLLCFDCFIPATVFSILFLGATIWMVRCSPGLANCRGGYHARSPD